MNGQAASAAASAREDAARRLQSALMAEQYGLGPGFRQIWPPLPLTEEFNGLVARLDRADD